jgi:hypothetical protein
MPDCFWRTHSNVLLLPNTDDRPKSLYQQVHCVQLRVRLNPNLHLITRLESRNLRRLIDLSLGGKRELALPVIPCSTACPSDLITERAPLADSNCAGQATILNIAEELEDAFKRSFHPLVCHETLLCFGLVWKLSGDYKCTADITFLVIGSAVFGIETGQNPADFRSYLRPMALQANLTCRYRLHDMFR